MLLSVSAQACYWQPHEPAFWPSQQIPVCFDPPDEDLTERQRAHFENSKKNITRAYKEQINERTSLTLSGFENCKDHRRADGSVRHDLPHAVRIKLTEHTGRAASGINAGANADGPNSGKSSVNIEIDFIGEGGAAAEEKWQAEAALHEFMHLLGIQHENLRENSKFYNRNLALGFITLGEFDPDSIMIQMRDEPDAILSEQDVKCVESIASKEIQNSK